MSTVGIAVIGRNEGAALSSALRSALRQSASVLYADSGSTDNSVSRAADLGVVVFELDGSRPFTAARGRNEGFARLFELAPDLQFIQFMDGDCELAEGWIEIALEAMQDPEVAVVCGRRRERHPERSPYNLLCDMEWDTPVGERDACGGDFLIRTSAFREIDGFDAGMIAGEEPELCLRLCRTGWRILRIDAEMTIHDARLVSFSGWWGRSVRTGYAYALGAAMHGREPERHFVRASLSTCFWGAILPLIGLFLCLVAGLASLSLIVAYPILAMVIYLRNPRPGFGKRARFLYAWSCVIAKFPQVEGQFRFLLDRVRRRSAQLIEYQRGEAP